MSVAPWTRREHARFRSTVEAARWFAEMARPGPADIWRVRVDGLWLEGDPDASGGGDDGWMIATEPIGPENIALYERDVSLSQRGPGPSRRRSRSPGR
jgi:hypothetical protein